MKQEAAYTPGQITAPEGSGLIAGTPHLCLDSERGIIAYVLEKTWDASTGKRHALPAKANAERLAHCWNCHDDLLDALRDALQTAEFEGHPFRPWHDKARAAVAKAEATTSEG